MELIRNFSKLGKGNAGIAGGKGASLGEMTSAGIPVPPGFVILAESFEQFLRENQIEADIDSILSKVNQKDINSVDGASAEIQSIILNSKMPADIETEILKHFAELDAEFVAVRSSATAEDGSSASWAGELESYLNTTRENLLENVQKCWASLFTPRAIFYRIEKNMHKDKVSVAVVIQKMVESEVSGICFTVHPVTEDHNQMVLEAGWGLGEAIVGGLITPDNYVVDKKNLEITDKYISEQSIKIVRQNNGTAEMEVAESRREVQKLSDGGIIELAKICLQIEKHYGFPCDIEWAYEKGKFYIVQSRPITTLSI
ncbi:MAG: PEP/pyruvate-binding domain-containing protein [bacterium]|nr:PEP/pyruvate-binding domain-containing protein [bacterium]